MTRAEAAGRVVEAARKTLKVGKSVADFYGVPPKMRDVLHELHEALAEYDANPNDDCRPIPEERKEHLIRDLSTLVSRLSYRLKRYNKDDQLIALSSGFIRRNGLAGSVLRTPTTSKEGEGDA